MRKPVISFLFVFFFLNTLCIPELSHASQKEQAPASAGKSRKHVIVKSDTWYSIAKKYAVPYADLRAANAGVPDNLRIGDSLIIPSSSSGKKAGSEAEKNSSAANKKTTPAGTHTVKAGENLTQIAKKYNVSVAQLTEWNQGQTKSLKVGQKLVVKDAAPVKAQASVKPLKVPVATVKVDSTAAHAAKTEPAVSTVRAKDSTTGKAGGKGEMVVPENSTAEIFAKGRKEITEEGAAAWIEDQEINPGKYFALHRTAPIGTIVKVTNRMNRRTVFVKVVGKLPDTGDNENIVLKISKAAADKLGVLDARFQAQLNYGVDDK